MLTDLDDFIGPAQACTNPLFLGGAQEGTPSPAGTASGRAGEVTIHVGKPDLIKASGPEAGGAARVSLNDCLACSGCVTTAEAVLVQQQSVGELQAAIASGEYSRVVVLLSPQTIASIAEHWESHGAAAREADSEACSGARAPSPRRETLSAGSVYARLATFLMSKGATDVADTGSSGDVALLQAAAEFVARVRAHRPSKRRPRWLAPGPSVALSDARVLVPPSGPESHAAAAGQSSAAAERSHSGLAPLHAATAAAAAAGHVPSVETVVEVERPGLDPSCSLPVLAGECPGWVCYAEKTCPQALPYMSTAKSAQQIAGAIAKRVLSSQVAADATREGAADGGSLEDASAAQRPRKGVLPGDVLVVAVMPCFDKKLEASRKDFVDDATRSKDVDLVLSSLELADWMDREGVRGPSDLEPADLVLDPKVDPIAVLRSLAPDGHELECAVQKDSGSGGYAAAIARQAACELWGLSWSQAAALPFDFEPGRNPDIATAVLRRPEGSRASVAEDHTPDSLEFVRAYGFRNVQGVVNRLRRGKSSAHYVEVMACPGGCPNGGGQTKPEASGATDAPTLIAEKEALRARATGVQARLERRVEGGLGFSRLARMVYSDVAPGGPLSSEALHLFHTRFHAVPKLPSTSGIKW